MDYPKKDDHLNLTDLMKIASLCDFVQKNQSGIYKTYAIDIEEKIKTFFTKWDEAQKENMISIEEI